jgi:uncharacterized protein with HEPN domain
MPTPTPASKDPTPAVPPLKSIREYARHRAKTDSAALMELHDIFIDMAYLQRSFDGDIPGDAFEPMQVSEWAYHEWIRMVGEAAAQIPKSVTSAHPEIPWETLRKIRNRVAHPHEKGNADWLHEYTYQQMQLPGGTPAPTTPDPEKVPPEEINKLRKAINALDTTPVPPEFAGSEEKQKKFREHMSHLKIGINWWAAANAFHSKKQDEFLASLDTSASNWTKLDAEEQIETGTNVSEKEWFKKHFFNGPEVIETRSAYNVLNITAGEMADKVSLLFERICGDERDSNFSNVHAAFSERRNMHAHSNNKMVLKNDQIRVGKTIDWIRDNIPEIVDDVYFGALLGNSAPDKARMKFETTLEDKYVMHLNRRTIPALDMAVSTMCALPNVNLDKNPERKDAYILGLCKWAKGFTGPSKKMEPLVVGSACFSERKPEMLTTPEIDKMKPPPPHSQKADDLLIFRRHLRGIASKMLSALRRESVFVE